MTSPTGPDTDTGGTGPKLLWPGAHPSRWHLLERVCELIEGWSGPFTRTQLHRTLSEGPRGWGAICQVVDTLAAHGLIRRVQRTHRGTEYEVATTQPHPDADSDMLPVPIPPPRTAAP